MGPNAQTAQLAWRNVMTKVNYV